MNRGWGRGAFRCCYFGQPCSLWADTLPMDKCTVQRLWLQAACGVRPSADTIGRLYIIANVLYHSKWKWIACRC